MTYASEVLADSPLDFYQMETSTGTDSGSGARTLTLSGGVTTGVAGKIGNGWSYDGTNDLATMATFPTITNAFTVEAWLKAPSYRGWTNDYPTVIRRDGTDIVLIRGRGSNLGVSPGEADIYLAGTSFQSGPANRIDDGNWHHIVLSVSTNQAKLYIDKVLISTTTIGKSSYSFGTGTAYVGGGNTAASAPTELFQGGLDGVAIYNTALSATRIAAHFDAATTVTYVDVSTLTASADVNAITIQDSMTFTSTGPAADNYYAASSPTANHGTDTTLSVSTTGVGARADVAGFRFTGVPAGSTIVSAKLKVYVDSITNFSANTHVTVDASSTQVTESSALGAATVAGGLGEVTKPAGAGWWEVDVTSAYAALVGNGLLVRMTNASTSACSMILQSREGANAPVLELAYISAPVPVTLDVSTLTASAAVVAATVEAGTKIDVSTLTASALSNDATVEGSADTSVSTLTASVSADDVTVEVVTNPNAVIDLETLAASAAAYDVTVVQAVTFDAGTQTVAVQTDDVTVEQTSSAVIDLDSPRTFVTRIGLTDVNGEPIVPTEDEDKFFQSTMFLNPYIWYRMSATSGTTEQPRIYAGVEPSGADAHINDGIYHGATIGLNEGPNGRKSVHFDGNAYFEQGEVTIGDLGGESNWPDSTIEFSIRTTKKDQFVMRMDDANYLGTQKYRVKDIYLKDGRLNLRVWAPSGNKNVISFDWVGKVDVADGNWHHIVLTNYAGGDYISDGVLEGLTFYVDGNLDIHRRYNVPLSFPDYIGGRVAYPGLNDTMYAPLQTSEWFVGDVSEVVNFHYALSQDQIFRQNDTLFGYDPVYVDTLGVDVNVGEVTAKGNTKRVLAINLGARDGTLSGTTAMGNQVSVGFQGLAYEGSDLTHAVAQNGFQFFTANAYSSPYDAPGPLGNVWWEDTYDVNRMLDLEKDLNVDDYDIVTVFGYPTSGSDWDDLDRNFSDWSLYGGPSARAQLENLMRQVRDFAVNGGGLYITDPSTAKAVGVIDDFDLVDTLDGGQYNPDTNGGPGTYFDRRAAEINPWGPPGKKNTISNPRVPPYQLQPSINYAEIATYFLDQHANNWQTVRALVDGLTDLPGRIITDAVWGRLSGSEGEYAAEKAPKRDEGLALGDTFVIMGTRGAGRGDQDFGSGVPISLTMRVFGQVAAPVSAVKAGTVVTTFADTYWKRDSGNTDVLAPNPYKDHALTVVVNPGDVLDGDVVQGRIFMNFSEGYANFAPYMQAVRINKIPSDAELAGSPYYETEESREWTYSDWRGTWAGNPGNGGTSTGGVVIDSSGNVIQLPGTNNDGDLVGISYTPRWPVEVEPEPTMHYRGLQWVGGGQDADGNATVGLETASVSAAVNAVTVETQKSSDVSVGTLEVLAEAWDDLDTEGQNTTVNLFTVTATAKAEPFIERIDLSTLTATVTAWPDADGLILGGDVVVLRLPTAHTILTLEDN